MRCDTSTHRFSLKFFDQNVRIVFFISAYLRGLIHLNFITVRALKSFLTVPVYCRLRRIIYLSQISSTAVDSHVWLSNFKRYGTYCCSYIRLNCSWDACALTVVACSYVWVVQSDIIIASHNALKLPPISIISLGNYDCTCIGRHLVCGVRSASSHYRSGVHFLKCVQCYMQEHQPLVDDRCF